jgi:hypothetical protein
VVARTSLLYFLYPVRNAASAGDHRREHADKAYRSQRKSDPKDDQAKHYVCSQFRHPEHDGEVLHEAG